MTEKTEATESDSIQPELLVTGGWVKNEPTEWSVFPLSYYKDFGDGDGATSVTFMEKLTIVTICDMDDNEIKVTGIQTMKQLQTLHLALSGQTEAPNPVTSQQQQPEAIPESVSSHRYLKLIIAGVISNKFNGSHPETRPVSRMTDRIHSKLLGRVELVRIRDTSAEAIALPDKDEKHLKGCFRRAITREIEPTWDNRKIAPLVVEIYTAITKAFLLIKRPVFDVPEAEARLTPVDFEAIDSLMAPRRDYLTDKVINDEVLTEAETIELRMIDDVLDGLETEYRRPAMALLKQIEASLQQETEAESVS